MNPDKQNVSAALSILVAGLISLFLTLLQPSEAESAFWMGFSKQRLVIFGGQLILLLLLTVTFCILRKVGSQSSFVRKISELLRNPENTILLRNILLGFALFLSFAFFYVTIFIPQALSPITGWLAFSIWVSYLLFIRSVRISESQFPERQVSIFPSWKRLSIQQKRITIAMLVLGLIYFCSFIPVNLKGAETPHDFLMSGGDEYVMYPVVVKMLAHQESLRFVFYRFFIYGDYIYGFPFYGFSALLLIPSKIFFGATFVDQTQLNLLILRQLVTVLPAVLSVFLFTYLATRFKRWWTSLGVFLILLTLPGVIYNNTHFWHPDSLNLLFIALTLFYLDRDELRFGRNFYFAAVACGLSIATRLFGLFFFLAVAGLLVGGVIKKVLTVKRAAVSGLIFILLMGGTMLIASPYLFHPGEYSSLQRLSERKQVDLAKGYNEPDPEGVYRTGFSAWWPYMTRWYGNGVTLGVLAFSTLAGLVGGKHRHFSWTLFAWLLAVGIYLIYFVVVKSFQYMLPFLVPLYCAALMLPGMIMKNSPRILSNQRINNIVVTLLSTGIAAIAIVQFVQNIQWILAHGIFA